MPSKIELKTDAIDLTRTQWCIINSLRTSYDWLAYPFRSEDAHRFAYSLIAQRSIFFELNGSYRSGSRQHTRDMAFCKVPRGGKRIRPFSLIDEARGLAIRPQRSQNRLLKRLSAVSTYFEQFCGIDCRQSPLHSRSPRSVDVRRSTGFQIRR